MQQHMKVKELVAAARVAASDLPPAAAQLMREVATRLDVTFIALSEALDQRVTLMAENEILRGDNSQDGLSNREAQQEKA